MKVPALAPRRLGRHRQRRRGHQLTEPRGIPHHSAGDYRVVLGSRVAGPQLKAFGVGVGLEEHRVVADEPHHALVAVEPVLAEHGAGAHVQRL